MRNSCIETLSKSQYKGVKVVLQCQTNVYSAIVALMLSIESDFTAEDFPTKKILNHFFVETKQRTWTLENCCDEIRLCFFCF